MSYIGNEPIVSATRTVTEVSATAGQTVFTANGGYTVGFIDVFVNGSKLTNSDFTATNGTTITLNEAAQASDIVRLEALGTFLTGNHVPLVGDSNITGNVNVSGNLGVGTSSPNARLEISTGGATKARITSTIDNNADLDFYTNGVYRGLIEGNSVGMLFGTVGALPNMFITNNTERMRIDSSGRVTMPYQPAFHVGVPEGGSVVHNTDIVFTTIRFNRGSHYNSSNGRFTAPVTGAYLFFISAIADSSVSRLSLFVNGSIAYGSSQPTQLRIDSSASGSEIVDGSKQAIINLNANDFVQVRYTNDASSSMNYPDWTNFGGYLLG